MSKKSFDIYVVFRTEGKDECYNESPIMGFTSESDAKEYVSQLEESEAQRISLREKCVNCPSRYSKYRTLTDMKIGMRKYCSYFKYDEDSDDAIAKRDFNNVVCLGCLADFFEPTEFYIIKKINIDGERDIVDWKEKQKW